MQFRRFSLIFLVITTQFLNSTASTQYFEDIAIFENTVNEHGQKMGIDGFLYKGVPFPIESVCTSGSDIFFFRINYKNKVDSLIYSGTLRRDVTVKIIENIYKTEGHWKFLNLHPGRYCWYAFPYYDYGGFFREPNDCSPAERDKQYALKTNALQ